MSIELYRQLLCEGIIKGCQEFYCGLDLQGGSWTAMNWDLSLYGFVWICICYVVHSYFLFEPKSASCTQLRSPCASLEYRKLGGETSAVAIKWNNLNPIKDKKGGEKTLLFISQLEGINVFWKLASTLFFCYCSQIDITIELKRTNYNEFFLNFPFSLCL